MIYLIYVLDDLDHDLCDLSTAVNDLDRDLSDLSTVDDLDRDLSDLSVDDLDRDLSDLSVRCVGGLMREEWWVLSNWCSRVWDVAVGRRHDNIPPPLEHPNVGGVSIRSRNGAPSRKGCVVNGQMTMTSNK